eukprot:TRINITY_DN2540_c0_g1_i2.p1 TRINITY_DN2540_c0_g1~~TRINITY_DN2540_c0_g1_i2.p1  ORF type:complete len:110 (+),score=6.03 TRINITY_DN2540_c0_g1_i2:181-510(+)
MVKVSLVFLRQRSQRGWRETAAVVSYMLSMGSYAPGVTMDTSISNALPRALARTAADRCTDSGTRSPRVRSFSIVSTGAPGTFFSVAPVLCVDTTAWIGGATCMDRDSF